MRVFPRAIAAGGVTALYAIAGCTSDTSKQDTDTVTPVSLRFESAPLRVVTKSDTVRLVVELAVSAEQKSTGLMERRQLADTAGMLFVYDSLQPPDAGFWMYRTRIPLDIAFADATGRIRAIRHMVPCEARIPEGCPIYPPDVPYQYALEVADGLLARRGVAVGDSIAIAAALRTNR
jgi:uncharacterized membrane protein (UPF0127 family)